MNRLTVSHDSAMCHRSRGVWVYNGVRWTAGHSRSVGVRNEKAHCSAVVRDVDGCRGAHASGTAVRSDGWNVESEPRQIDIQPRSTADIPKFDCYLGVL